MLYVSLPKRRSNNKAIIGFANVLVEMPQSDIICMGLDIKGTCLLSNGETYPGGRSGHIKKFG